MRLKQRLQMTNVASLRKVKNILISYFVLLITCLSVTATNAQDKQQLSGNIAQEKKRVKPPVGAEPDDFVIPKLHTISLINGLKVTFIPFGELPKTTIRLVSNTGTIDEGKTPWLAQLSIDALKQQIHLSGLASGQPLTSVEDDVKSYVGTDNSWLEVDVLEEYSAQAISLLASAVIKPQLLASEFTLIKEARQRQVALIENNLWYVAKQALLSELFPHHPYGNLNLNSELIKRVSLADFVEFVSADIVPGQSHLYIAGAFDQAKLSEVIHQAFSGWKLHQKPIREKLAINYQPRIHFITPESVQLNGEVQTHLLLAKPLVAANNDNYIPLLVVNQLIASRIKLIVEQQPYSARVENTIINNRAISIWQQKIDVGKAHTGKLAELVFNQLEALKTQLITTSELNEIKDYLAGRFILSNASRTGTINQLSFLVQHDLEHQFLEQYVDRIYRVSVNDIQLLVNQYFDTNQMVVVVVGDRAIVEPQLKQIKALKMAW